jgi:hypothetical protein
MNNDHSSNRTSRRTRLLAVTAAAVLATATACGGKASSVGGTSSAGSASGVSADHQNHLDGSQLLKLAQCMRTHGVPGFPRPEISGGNVILPFHGAVNFGSPQFENAERACKSLIPPGLFPSAS